MRYDYKDIENNLMDGILCNTYPFTFSSERINPSTIPHGMYLYEVRGDDECGDIPCQVGKSIAINFYGSIITGCELPLNDDGYIDLDDNLNSFILLDEKTLKEMFVDLFGDDSGIIPFVQERDDEGNVISEHPLTIKDLLEMANVEED